VFFQATDGRQDSKGRAFTIAFTLGEDDAAVQFDDMADDGQADAQPTWERVLVLSATWRKVRSM